MPSYWAQGFQLCRFGYDNIENMKAAVDRTAQYSIPHVSDEPSSLKEDTADIINTVTFWSYFRTFNTEISTSWSENWTLWYIHH
jgi:hypothetical protein